MMASHAMRAEPTLHEARVRSPSIRSPMATFERELMVERERDGVARAQSEGLF